MKISRNPAVWLAVSALVFAALALQGVLREGPVVERTGVAMGTTIQIRVPQARTGDRRRVENAIDRAFQEIARVESVFSVYRDTSEISRINRLRKGDELVIGREAFALIEKSISGSRESGGAFDITVKPLVDLWGRAREAGALPSPEAVRQARARVGWQDVVLDRARGSIAFRKDGMALDMGAVAKGYATDRAVAVLKAGGITDAIVRAGGDVYCLGARRAGTPWKVGIRHPRDKDRLFMELELRDRAIDTAGDYEKFFMLGGRRYSHIIDPRTGYPIGEDVVSATVIAADATSADWLATAACVLGRDGLELADRAGGMAVIVIKQGDTFRTEMAGNVTGVIRVDRPHGL